MGAAADIQWAVTEGGVNTPREAPTLRPPPQQQHQPPPGGEEEESSDEEIVNGVTAMKVKKQAR